LKERYITRHINVEKNLQAIEEATWFISYLIDFPTSKHYEVVHAPFLPLVNYLEPINSPLPKRSTLFNTAIDDVLQSLPPVMVTSFFGP